MLKAATALEKARAWAAVRLLPMEYIRIRAALNAAGVVFVFRQKMPIAMLLLVPVPPPFAVADDVPDR